MLVFFFFILRTHSKEVELIYLIIFDTWPKKIQPVGFELMPLKDIHTKCHFHLNCCKLLQILFAALKSVVYIEMNVY